MATKGYFVITDITGYTAYLTHAGLEEAQNVLNVLFEGLLEAMHPPLQISNFQGDAILAYVPEGSFIQGQTFLEILENIYVAFAKLLEQMDLNSGCDCDACEKIPELDLKLFVHYGTYVLQTLRGRQELSGPDVILAHRMMKNTVREETGLKSYALLTAAALDAMQVEWMRDELRPYVTAYEHFGEVQMYVHDLGAVYARARETQRVLVDPAEAWLSFAADLPVPPPLAWDYLTRAENSRIWLQMDSIQRADEAGGRVDSGTRFQCARNATPVDYTIVDWRPFEYFTIEGIGLGAVPYLATYRLTPMPHGSRFEWHWHQRSAVPVTEIEPLYKRACQTSIATLQAMLADDLATGKIVTAG